jgi:hypothetical protein
MLAPLLILLPLGERGGASYWCSVGDLVWRFQILAPMRPVHKRQRLEGPNALMHAAAHTPLQLD